MKIKRLPIGVYAANCYLFSCKDTGEGIVIDPGGEAELVAERLERDKIKAKAIVLTHSHGDHIGGVNQLRELLDIPVWAHEDEEELLLDADKNLSSTMIIGATTVEADLLFRDGDSFEIGDCKLEIIHTPGHTKGGACLKIGDIIFTGDTIFRESIGRSDLPSGDSQTLIESIKSKLLSLDDDIKLYPGHGLSTTVGHERAFNQFLR